MEVNSRCQDRGMKEQDKGMKIGSVFPLMTDGELGTGRRVLIRKGLICHDKTFEHYPESVKLLSNLRKILSRE